ncbi:MAG: hypothetical protein K9H26_10690 [Prolixibacteraceae bacterium]|nr:hypothetical protein [Prolixibacteraceae bacterium]
MSTLSYQTEQGLQPNLIDEVSDNETYLGFAKNGDETNECAIIKILKVGDETRFLCPGAGRFDFAFDWAHRKDGSYNYQLRKL